jgi:hypothetical protein
MVGFKIGKMFSYFLHDFLRIFLSGDVLERNMAWLQGEDDRSGMLTSLWHLVRNALGHEQIVVRDAMHSRSLSGSQLLRLVRAIHGYVLWLRDDWVAT